jgi:1-acyl-sn-glycerol-3-phosphate acyltransferase
MNSDERQRRAAGSARGPLADWLQPVVDAVDERVVQGVQRDPFQRDPRAVRELLPYLKAWCLYFGAELRGWEHVPPEGPFLVVGNHSGGVATNDAAPFVARWVEERGPDAPLYGLAYDLLFAYPVVGRALPKLGMLPASPENAREALARNAAVIVFPGGDHEVFRPWTRRNRIDFAGRRGFVELALESGVPVLPMTIHGAHQSTFVLTRGRRLARRMGLERLQVKVFPLIWNIPFGVTPAYLPSVPLPAKITVELGKPIDWSHYGPAKARDPGVLQRCYDEITGTMQRTMDALDREHPYPVLTRLNELRPINVLRRLRARRRDAREPRRLPQPPPTR